MWSPDGSTLWVGQWFSTQVYAYNLADETANYSENWTLHNPATVSESNRKPTGIWSNGTHIYVTDPDHDRVFQYNAGDKSLTSTTYSLHADNGNRQGLWSDGTTAWVSDNVDDKLYAYQLSDFSRQSGKDIDLLHGRVSFAKNLKRDDTNVAPFGQFPPSFRLFKLCCRSCESLICGNRQRGERDGAEIETPVTQAVYPPGIRAAPGGDSVQWSRPGPDPA